MPVQDRPSNHISSDASNEARRENVGMTRIPSRVPASVRDASMRPGGGTPGR